MIVMSNISLVKVVPPIVPLPVPLNVKVITGPASPDLGPNTRHNERPKIGITVLHNIQRNIFIDS